MTSPSKYLADRSRTNAREELYVDYEGTPYLTGLTQLCSAIGTFIGVYTLIVLLGSLHRGLSYYWWLVLILVVDIGLNVGVRVARARKRRRLGLSRAERMWRNGVGPGPGPSSVAPEARHSLSQAMQESTSHRSCSSPTSAFSTKRSRFLSRQGDPGRLTGSSRVPGDSTVFGAQVGG
jgi:hypothetical protein